MDMEQLTRTELRIAQLVADGHQDKEIARDIGVSYDACRQRLRILSQKIGAQNRAMVAAWYVRRVEVRS
jgi:DNA-binding CsgD family transcriptional regulator